MSIIGAAQQQDRNRIGGLYTPVGDTGVVALYSALGASNFTLSGDQVTQWNDTSGNGRHAPATANTMTYDSTNNWVKGADATGKRGVVMPSTTTGRLYAVMQRGVGTETTWVGAYNLLSGNHASGYGALKIVTIGASNTFNGSAQNIYYAGDTIKKNGSATNTGNQLPMPMSLLVFTVGSTERPVTQINTIGCLHYQNGSSWIDPIKLLLFTDGSENDTLRQKREGWCAHQCGTQSLLIAEHPWITEPPTA